ncbi:MAG TPA: caspase family protein [Saprospiraceae bacterium]|nr:caspase family protein [Saprospiraceae bacterium]
MRKLLLFSFLIFLGESAAAQRCIKGDCKNGFGTLMYSMNVRYTGEFRNGKMHGKGIYYYANGGKYLGEWQNGQRQGEGKWIQANGNVYQGSFKTDKPFGQGTMVFKNNDKYVGNWSNEMPNGKGTFYTAHGERYEGDFVNGEYEGQGIYYYKDGAVYKGDWKKSKRNGNGEYKDKNGVVKSGQWANDVALKVFEEELDDLVFEADPDAGPGKKPNSNSEVKPEETSTTPASQTEQNKAQTSSSQAPATESHVEENLPNCNQEYCESGRGILTYADGSKYVGEFVEGDPEGKGICYYANGDRYEGQWKNHAPNGEGVMFFASGVVYGAMWDNGNAVKQIHSREEYKFNQQVKVDYNKEVKIWAVVVGVAKYEHMPALKYADDDAYKIYAFLKSPEGGALQDEQIRVLVDEDATRANMIRAMNEIFLKADDNDVIMLYFSGHGLEGTFLPIDYDGFKNSIHHDEIKELFSKSKAKHKVCFADACHSGSLLAAKSPFASSLMYFYDELDKASGGTAFMMSSKSKEFSLEDGGLRQGIFSHFLIRGLKGEADTDKNNTITIQELFNFVSTQVKTYTVGAQTPMIAGDYNENMPVGFIRK